MGAILQRVVRCQLLFYEAQAAADDGSRSRGAAGFRPGAAI